MHARDYHYDLPDDRIARRPASPRESCRLMVIDRSSGAVAHRRFTDLHEYLKPGDCLVLNDAAVRRARLFARRESGGRIEVFLIESRGAKTHQALLKPVRRLRLGETLRLEDDTPLTILSREADGTFLVSLDHAEHEMSTLGHVPLPPYMGREDDERDLTDYQTVFAAAPTAVAAPTAGLHFSAQQLEALQRMGVEQARVNLAVGLGTFRPLPDLPLAEIHLHRESYSISAAEAGLLNDARREDRRLVAIGTTAVRVLESQLRRGDLFHAGEFATELFLKPGDAFKAIDALLTNFHAPGSSLLCLIDAFLQQGPGADSWRALYAEALREGYRFLSYGDAMLIL